MGLAAVCGNPEATPSRAVHPTQHKPRRRNLQGKWVPSRRAGTPCSHSQPPFPVIFTWKHRSDWLQPGWDVLLDLKVQTTCSEAITVQSQPAHKQQPPQSAWEGKLELKKALQEKVQHRADGTARASREELLLLPIRKHMGRLSCLPSYPWPFHLASQGPCSNTRGLEGTPWQGSPCPALGREPGGEEHSAPPCVPVTEGQCKILGVQLSHHHHPPSAQNTHSEQEAAALLGRVGSAARLSVLPAGTQAVLTLQHLCASAQNPCSGREDSRDPGGFQSLALPGPRSWAAASMGTGQCFRRAFQEQVDFHSFEAQ